MKVIVRYSDGGREIQFSSAAAIPDSAGNVRHFEAILSRAFTAIADQFAVQGEIAKAWIELEDGRKPHLSVE